MIDKDRMAPSLPKKNFFRIGEVSKLTGLRPSVLRYWETEFKKLRPLKTRSQHRIYQKKDVLFILELKRLLYEKKFTIKGAKKALEETDNPVETPLEETDRKVFLKQTIKEVKEELTNLKDLLE